MANKEVQINISYETIETTFTVVHPLPFSMDKIYNISHKHLYL